MTILDKPVNIEHTDMNVHYWYIRSFYTLCGRKECNLIHEELTTDPWIGYDSRPVQSFKTIEDAKRAIKKILKRDSDFISFDIVPFTEKNIIKDL